MFVKKRGSGLERSYVSTLKSPTTVNMVASKLTYPGLGISKIHDLERYKFLVTFATKRNIEGFSKVGRDLFLEIFDEII